MKDGKKYRYQGYYIAHVLNPQPDFIYLNSTFGLMCLAVEIARRLSMTTSKRDYVESKDLRCELTKSIWNEDFTFANRLLSDHQLRVFMLQIE